METNQSPQVRGINLKLNPALVIVLFLAAFISFIFHEFGHWLIGEILGNDMLISLNNVSPKQGSYIAEWHETYILAGGPAFTIIESVIALIVIEKSGLIYAYPFLFFPFIMRIFSLTFGGFAAQDEAKISAIMNAGKFSVALIVCSLLFLLLWRGSHKLKLDWKFNNIFLFYTIIFMVLVIFTSKFL